jgi:hypothetical protein
MINKHLRLVIINVSSSKKYLIAFGCASLLLISIKLFNYSLTNHRSDDNYEDYFNSNYKIFNIRIPKNLNFAGEKVPVSNLRIHKAMEEELVKNTYWQSQSLVLHKRASKWFPVIEPILKKNNIPDDFKYIALVESQLTNVISPQGATGFWQIIESTGKGYGMEITNEVDDRYHVIKSTEMACKYFNEAHKQFNNWTLVAASYNLGMNGIRAQLNKQKVDNYYDLHLTEETRKYVFRILTMKEIISRPKVYGFMLRKRDMHRAIPTKFITVDTSISNLSEFANAIGINYTVLKHLNPWLKTNTLTQTYRHLGLIPIGSTTSKKRYLIEIPINKVSMADLGLLDKESETTIAKDSTFISIAPSAMLIDTINFGSDIKK